MQKNIHCRNSFFRRIIITILLFAPAVSIAHATTYHVGTGQTYPTLEDLRQDIDNGTIVWEEASTIVIHNADGTLTSPLNWWDTRVLLQGNAVISPADPDVQFIGASNSIIINSESLLFDGFVTGSYGGVIYADEIITVAGGTNVFSNNEAYFGGVFASGGVVFLNGNHTFWNNEAGEGGAIGSYYILFRDGVTLFTQNKANYGGAIMGDEIRFSGGENTFLGNTAQDFGGAIYGYKISMYGGKNVFTSNGAGEGGGAIFGDEIHFSGGENIFTDNGAIMYGGAIGGYKVSFLGGTNAFSNNVVGGSGGAIASDSEVSFFGGTNIFSNNSAFGVGMGQGGAIYSQDAVNFFGGTNSFIGNSADDAGGAIYGNEKVNIIGGANTFSYNVAIGAGSRGGAIYAHNNATLIASSGNLIFQNNYQNYDTTFYTGDRNAIYMENDGDDDILTLAAKGSNKILFYDPIESDSSRTNLTININGVDSDGDDIVDGTTDGTVLFDMYQSKIYGNTVVHGGTMQLTNRAIYGGGAANPLFQLKSGATLLTDVHSNEIQADHIVLENGSTLAFDMEGSQQNGITKNLILNESTASGFGQKVGAGNIELRNFRGVAVGKYQLADTNQSGAADASGHLLSGGAKMQLETEGGSNEELWLNIMSVYNFVDTPNLRRNSLVIANMLDADPAHPLYAQLNMLTESEMTTLIDQMPGDIFVNAQFAVADLRKEFNALLSSSYQKAINESERNSWAMRGQSPDELSNYFARRPGKKLSGLWATPTGSYINRSAPSGYYGYDLGNFGIAVGKSQQYCGDRVIGVAFGYDYSQISLQHVTQRDNMQSLDVALYGSRHGLCGRFTDWHVGYAKNWHDTKRFVGGSTAESDFHDNVFSFGITTGRHLGIWTPSIGVEMVQVWSPAHIETGSNMYSLAVSNSGYTSLEIPVGTRLAKTFTITSPRNHISLTPEFRMFWVPQLADQNSSMVTSFTSGSPQFVVDGGEFGWQHMRFGTGLAARFSNTFSASLNYDASVYSGQTRHVASASMMIRF